MIKQRKIELLAPAKNLECGIEAVNHGADAVYIGAPKFGARAAAVNSLEDIAALVEHAHLYNARIYVTVNTILKEEELKETERMIWELYRIGVDALIVQDMGITRLNLPPIPLHGSTQMDNRTPEKVRFLADAGFRQVVLARELSLQEIRGIHEACPDVPLEVFVHGALCVSYSGQWKIIRCWYLSIPNGIGWWIGSKPFIIMRMRKIWKKRKDMRAVTYWMLWCSTWASRRGEPVIGKPRPDFFSRILMEKAVCSQVPLPLVVAMGRY